MAKGVGTVPGRPAVPGDGTTTASYNLDCGHRVGHVERCSPDPLSRSPAEGAHRPDGTAPRSPRRGVLAQRSHYDPSGPAIRYVKVGAVAGAHSGWGHVHHPNVGIAFDIVLAPEQVEQS